MSKPLRLNKIPICAVQTAKFAQQASGPIYVRRFDEFDFGRKNLLLWPSKDFPFPGEVRSSIPQPNGEVKSSWKDLHKDEAAANKATINLQKALKMCSNAVEADKNYSPGNASDEIHMRSGPFKVSIMKCPLLIKRIAAKRFENIEWASNSIFAVSIELDYKSGSNADLSSEDLKRSFMSIFTKISDLFSIDIRSRNYWADFIDPKTGMPRGCDPSQSFLQQDDELAESGYKILEIGFCKAITDVCLDGSNLTGLIFTDAPRDIIMHAIQGIEEFLQIVIPVVRRSVEEEDGEGEYLEEEEEH